MARIKKAYRKKQRSALLGAKHKVQVFHLLFLLGIGEDADIPSLDFLRYAVRDIRNKRMEASLVKIAQANAINNLSEGE